jgi:DNA-binding PadR family transcriptional regulator
VVKPAQGYLDAAILQFVSRREMHGYELVHQLNAFHSSYLAAGEGTVYPLLMKMEHEKLLASRWEGRRKYYKITAKGRKVLETRRTDLAGLGEILTTLFAPTAEVSR